MFGLGPRDAMEPVAQCAGWLSERPHKKEPPIIYANGGTAGSTCALYIRPADYQAIAVLSNNGVAATIWAGIKLRRKNTFLQACRVFNAFPR